MVSCSGANSSALIIRPFRDSDMPGCLAILDSNVPDFFHTEERTRFADFLTALPGPAWVGWHEVSDDPVAFGAVTLTEDGQTAWLRWGIVHATCHRRGWGRALLKTRLEWIAERTEASKVRVATTEPVHGFFVHRGFETTGIVPDGIGPGMDRFDLERLVER